MYFLQDLLRQVKSNLSRIKSSKSTLRPGWAGFAHVVKMVLIFLLVAGFFAAGIGGGALVGYINTSTPVPIVMLKSTGTLTTHIYDNAGNVLTKITGSENIDREIIAYDDVKATTIDDAFIAIEDERFEEHIGIDPKRIASAILSALSNGGTATHGGSTITQQTVKMLTGADQPSARRKIQEWYQAVDLETKLTKAEIMELYLNLVPMANNYVGIQSAAKAYFGKPASALNLSECAFLAGIPKSPTYYNPRTESGLRNALRRQRIVLGKMLELGKISQTQFDEAINTELRFHIDKQDTGSSRINTYFVDYVIDAVTRDLMARLGYSRDLAETAIYNSGLQIHTTMDPAMQAALDQTFMDEKLFVRDPALVANYPEHAQAGMVVIEQKTGQIKALYGGFGAKTVNRGINRATGIARQPGSSIKPIGVYGPAIDLGRITGATLIEDKALFYNPQTPTVPYPINVNKTYLGNLTVREAVRQSTNTIAMYVWKEVVTGVSSLNYLKLLGIDRMKENYPAIALGGFNVGMSPLEMAGAYTALANSGKYIPPYAYTQVQDSAGKVLLDNTAPVYKAVFKPDTAYEMTDILVDTAPNYGKILNTAGQQIKVAAKSGTSDENRDRWLVGYTPYYTAAVWYGYDNRLKTITVPSVDHNSPFDIWFTAMTRIHATLAPLDFDRPATIKEIKVCRASGQLPIAGICTDVISEFFTTGSPLIPTKPCSVHQPAPKPTVATGKPGNADPKPTHKTKG